MALGLNGTWSVLESAEELGESQARCEPWTQAVYAISTTYKPTIS